MHEDVHACTHEDALAMRDTPRPMYLHVHLRLGFRKYVFARAVGRPCTLSATLYCMTLLSPAALVVAHLRHVLVLLYRSTTRLFTRVHFDFPLAQSRMYVCVKPNVCWAVVF